MNCPDENIWFDVAGGLLSPEESMVYIQHAATCDSCSQKLRAATRIFADELSPAEEETLNSLPSNTPARQRELAQSLGQASRIQQDNPEPVDNQTSSPFWSRLFLYAVPAAAFLTVVLIASYPLYAKYQLRAVKESVDREYSKGRPTYYRLAGMPYQRSRNELGAVATPPAIDVPKLVLRRDPQLAAEAAFLEDDPGSAKKILEQARRSGNASAAILNDLAIAIALEARSQADYEHALAISEEAVQKSPDNAAAYFNRVLIFERLKRSQDARKSLEQFRHLEHDPGWLADADKILPSS